MLENIVVRCLFLQVYPTILSFPHLFLFFRVAVGSRMSIETIILKF